jgi:hypothetical protein
MHQIRAATDRDVALTGETLKGSNSHRASDVIDPPVLSVRWQTTWEIALCSDGLVRLRSNYVYGLFSRAEPLCNLSTCSL